MSESCDWRFELGVFRSSGLFAGGSRLVWKKDLGFKVWGRGAGVEGIMDPGPRFKSAFGLQASSQLSRVPSGNWVTFVIFCNHWQVGRSGHTMSYIRWHVDKQGSAHRATPNRGVI